MQRWLACTLLLGACTDADIYTATGAEPFRPDRIAVTGRLCTEDTTGPKFPVKILLMVDNSSVMFDADPNFYRFCGPGTACAPGSINAFIDRTRNQQNARIGFAGIADVAKPVVPINAALCQPPPCNAQQFFPARDVDGGLVQNDLALPGGARRDVANAIAQAESFITADMANSSAGEILRSRYLVYMLLAGPPPNSGSPDVVAANLARDVERLKDLVYSRGALEFRLHVGYLYLGPRSIEGPPAGYSCCIDPGTCACGSANTDPCCATVCTVQGSPPNGFGSWDAWNDAAQRAYSSMAFAGDGLYREFECPTLVEFRLDQATTSVRLKRKDIIAYNMNVRLGPDGPITDSDGDGLMDIDSDDDGVLDAEEAPGVDPTLWDTDGDGLSDRLEYRAFPRQDPLDPNDRPAACPDPALLGLIPDQDLDMLNDCEEGLLQTSATIPDTDGDGLPDALEFMAGTVPTSSQDRLLDFDGDGVVNAEEVLDHTNPRTNDGRLRGAEGYRTNITDLGVRTVATMEDRPELRAVSFRSASANVAGGAGLLRWDPSARTLEWSDARWQTPPPFTPVPREIDDGTNTYTLYAENASTGEQISVEVFVVEPWLPDVPTEVFPHISISDRNCYDVRISNIKLMETMPATTILNDSEHEKGTNHILVFFTQAPEDRLDSPGISKVAEIPVVFQCTDPDVIESCARSPESGFVELTDADFAASVP